MRHLPQKIHTGEQNSSRTYFLNYLRRNIEDKNFLVEILEKIISDNINKNEIYETKFNRPLEII